METFSSLGKWHPLQQLTVFEVGLPDWSNGSEGDNGCDAEKDNITNTNTARREPGRCISI